MCDIVSEYDYEFDYELHTTYYQSERMQWHKTQSLYHASAAKRAETIVTAPTTDRPLAEDSSTTMEGSSSILLRVSNNDIMLHQDRESAIAS
jgi:hypothetical protein